VFEPIHRVVLHDNVVCGSDEMVVYRLDWSRLGPAEEEPRRPYEGTGEGSETRPCEPSEGDLDG